MITKDMLKSYAKKLMFTMSDSEYDTLEKEFDVILKQMDKIDKIEGIENVEPMTFPFITNQAKLRKDEVKDCLTIKEVLSNASVVEDDQVKVPKVVE